MAHAHAFGTHHHIGWHDSTVHHSALVERLIHSSPAAVVLVALPAFFGALLIAPATGLVWDPFEYAVLGAVFYIAGVALAAVDEHTLSDEGIKRPATAYWALLTVVPYLNARTSALAKESESGLAVQWAAITTIMATGATLAIIAMG